MPLLLFSTLRDFYAEVTEGRSKLWPSVRQKFLIWQPECQACGNKVWKNLNVHHIKPFHAYPELELVWTNLITLCERGGPAGMNCHLSIGHTGNWKEWNPTVVEDARYFREMLKKRLTTRVD